MKFLKAFSYAFSGLKRCFRDEPNFRFHIFFGALVYLCAVFAQITSLEYMLVTTAVILVLAAEMFNTSFEHTVDLHTKEYNETAKYAKDISAGAVLLCAVYAAVIGFVIFVRMDRIAMLLTALKNPVLPAVMLILLGVFLLSNGLCKRKGER